MNEEYADVCEILDKLGVFRDRLWTLAAKTGAPTLASAPDAHRLARFRFSAASCVSSLAC
jgi:hypothetical protein